MDFMLWALGILASGGFGLIGWVVQGIKNENADNKKQCDELEKRFEANRLHNAETFATKLEVRDMTKEIVAKLDKIDDKLDRKADKS